MRWVTFDCFGTLVDWLSGFSATGKWWARAMVRTSSLRKSPKGKSDRESCS